MAHFPCMWLGKGDDKTNTRELYFVQFYFQKRNRNISLRMHSFEQSETQYTAWKTTVPTLNWTP